MKLSRSTVCNKFEIRNPRWKQRVVGLAAYKVGTHNEVEITKTNKDGERYFPQNLYGSGDMIRTCETQVLNGGTKLYLVPIAKLEVLERE